MEATHAGPRRKVFESDFSDTSEQPDRLGPWRFVDRRNLLHVDTFFAAEPQRIGNTVFTFSTAESADNPMLFLSWSASGTAPTRRRFSRLAAIVESIQSHERPEASDELWGLIDRATELRSTDPGTDEEIQEWATRLANQVIDADD